MGRLPFVFFLVVASYLVVVVVVQFFLAGLGVFGSTGYDAHRGVGFVLLAASLVLLVLAVVAKLPKRVITLAAVLLGLNILQAVLANIDDVPELAALHVVNALAIFVLAHFIMRRSWRYLPSREVVTKTAA